MDEQRADPTRPGSSSGDGPSRDGAANDSWWRSHRWQVGGIMALAAVGGGVWWRRRTRRRRIELAPMSVEWLQGREYEAGQRQQD